MKRFLYRILLFNFLFLFPYFKFYRNYKENKKDFKNRILKYSHFTGINLNKYEKKLQSIFPIFLACMPTFAFFSILNYKFFQVLSGILTIYIAFIYVNPIQRIQYNIMNYPYKGWVNFLPSHEFSVITVLGLAMICYAFYLDSYIYAKKKENEKQKQD